MTPMALNSPAAQTTDRWQQPEKTKISFN